MFNFITKQKGEAFAPPFVLTNYYSVAGSTGPILQV